MTTMLVGRGPVERLIAMLAFIEWVSHERVLAMVDRLADGLLVPRRSLHAKLNAMCSSVTEKRA